MRRTGSAVLFILVCLSLTASAQDDKVPDRKINELQCRADTQKWTFDPFDKAQMPATGGQAIMVNGQFRSISHITPHVTMTMLMERVHEMAVCKTVDSDFEKQFDTYSTIYEVYEEEITFHYDYFLTRHNLRHQFFKEDEEENKSP